MPLTLTVLRCPPSVAPEVRQVTGGEFSIGRGADNDWVLPDPARQLSKRHCVIAYRQGSWQIAGTSTNGTFVNRDETPLESRAPHTLRDGDRLTLGVYEIEASVVEDVQPSWGRTAAASGAKPDPLANPFDDDPFATPPLAGNTFGGDSFPRPQAVTAGSQPDLTPFSARLPAEFDPLLPDDPVEFSGPSRDDHSSAVSDAINLPPAKTVLPDDWDLDLSPGPVPQPEVPPVVTFAPVAATVPAPVPPPSVEARTAPSPASDLPAFTSQAVAPDALLAAFLRGAGMDDVTLPDPVHTMQHLGAAFRAMVSGIRHVLIARSEVKREFRIEATLIRRRGNNLLKFSADDDDALAGLLGAGRQTDMGPEEAITDALRDIRLHELATVTAMQTAVRALVERLGPNHVRDAKDQGGLALLGNRKARAWEAYEALHAEVLRGLSDDFDSLFGKRFAVAYEQAMQELLAKSERPDDRR